MEVTRIVLENFLSYGRADVSPAMDLNVVFGENASGKTNLIDSLYFASVGRSSRHTKDKELIKWDTETGARVTIFVKKKYSKHIIDIYIDPEGRKRIAIDGLPIQKIGELLGVLNIVWFSPAEIALVKDTPADRRRFVDISLSQQSKTYFYTLQRYNKLLVQRNSILKNYSGRPALADMLAVVDADFLRCASYIIAERKKFIERLSPLAAKAHSALTDGSEALALTYETEAVDFEKIAATLAEVSLSTMENDCRLGYTTAGPHRDDLKISANGIDLRRFGSQGQQRSAVLSLKLAEIAAFVEKTGETPVLLLDDVLSELDGKRQTALFNAIQHMQTIITCTEINGASEGVAVFEVKDREVIRRK